MSINPVNSSRVVAYSKPNPESKQAPSNSTTSQSTLYRMRQGASEKHSLGATICGCILCGFACLVALFHCVTCGIFMPRRDAVLEKMQQDVKQQQNELDRQIREYKAQKPQRDAETRAGDERLKQTKARSAALCEVYDEEIYTSNQIIADCLAEKRTPEAIDKAQKRMNQLKAEMEAKRQKILGQVPSDSQRAS
jgi:hypothetical protein